MSVDTEGKKTVSNRVGKSSRDHQERVAMLGKALRKSDL